MFDEEFGAKRQNIPMINIHAGFNPGKLSELKPSQHNRFLALRLDMEVQSLCDLRSS